MQAFVSPCCLIRRGSFGHSVSGGANAMLGRYSQSRRSIGVGPHVALVQILAPHRGHGRELGAARRQSRRLRFHRATLARPRCFGRRGSEQCIGGGDLVGVTVLRLRWAVVRLGEFLPLLGAQRRQVRRARDEAREARQLLVGAGVLLRDERLDVGATAVDVVEPHDLEQAPARGLQRRGPIEVARRFEPLPLPGRAARVPAAIPRRVTQVRRLLREPPARQAVKRVGFEQDLRPRRLAAQKPGAGRLDRRHGLQRGLLHVEGFREARPGVVGQLGSHADGIADAHGAVSQLVDTAGEIGRSARASCPAAG